MIRFLSGLRHCHIQGLNSYVLRERLSSTEGMLRIFHNLGNSLCSLLDETGDYRIAPHNHRQNITLYPLFGSSANVGFRVDRRAHGKKQFEYSFGSALQSGQFSLQFHDTVELTVEDVAPLPATGLFLAHNQVHTVVAAPESAWLVVEGWLPGWHKDFCYSKRHDFKLDSTDLYQKMNESDLRLTAVAYFLSCPILKELKIDV